MCQALPNENIDSSEEYLTHLLGEDGKQPVDAEVDFVELTLPPWFDAELFRRSQKFYKKYLTAIFSGMLTGLISVLAIPSILNVLICTKKSNTPMAAYRRYVKTIYHVIAWNVYELKPGSKSWKSIEMVRKTHLTARKMCENTAAAMTITQRDMALTQFGFMGYVNLRPKMLGIHNDVEEFLEANNHFWRVLGYMMGIKDEFNLCTDSWKTTCRRLQIVQEKVFKPALEEADSNFYSMTKSLVHGLWYFSYHLNWESALFVTKRLAGCKNYEYFDSDFKDTPTQEIREKMEYNQLSGFQKYKVSLFIYVHEIAYKNQIIRWYMNFDVYLGQVISYYFPYVAIIFFGIRKAYVRIFYASKKSN